MTTNAADAQTVTHLGRTYELRPFADGSERVEWREAGHGWRVAASERNAILLIGGHARLHFTDPEPT